MAEQKTYSIKIDGIEQSVKGVESLGDAVNKTSKTFEDYSKVVEKVQRYQEAYSKIEEAEFRKQVKNQYELKQARETVAAGMGKTYAEQQRYLTALGKVIKNTEGDVSDLIKEYNKLNDTLKKVDAEMGNHQRNVGNYTSALGEFNKPFSNVVNVAKAATSALQLYNGVMAAFSVNNEEATEAMKKLMSTMSIIQSLNQLNQTLKEGTVMGDLFTKTMKVMTLGIEGTTTATKLLKYALMGIGIGLLVIAITTLITQWDKIKKLFTDTFPILGQLEQKFGGIVGAVWGLGNAIKKFCENIFVNFVETIKNLVHGKWSAAWESAKKVVTGSLDGVREAFWDGVTSYKAASTEVVETTTKTANDVKAITQELLDSLVKMEKKALDEIKKEREASLKAEEQRLARLNKLKDKDRNAEYEYQKAMLQNDLAYARTEEEKLAIQQKLIDLEKERNKEIAKRNAADDMGISIEELQQRLEMTDEKWTGLNEEQKQVLQTLITQLETIKTAADTAGKKLSDANSGSTSGSTDGGKKKGGFGNQFMDFGDNGGVNWGDIKTKIEDAYDAFAAPIVEGLGDSIHMMMEMAIEEAEAALEQAEQMHDEAVDKVSESKDRLSDLNEKMKESSGAQLEAYKTQMADEMLLLQEREQEERRLQKEKEKREKELEKQKKKQRKLELQQQLIQAIVSGALAVVNGLATQPFVPLGIAMGALAGAAAAVQIATITKQMSKLADGGLLQGRSHAQGGIAVGNTGIEVEGGEYVVNRRSTAKYLPLLQQINEEGARHKTAANQIGKFADGGQLNYQRISENADALSAQSILANAINAIDFHPVVSVVDINRGQKNLTEVRQLAGANS